MPITNINGGYKWGKSGKIYPTKAGATRQARAAYASGYEEGGPVSEDSDRAVSVPGTGEAALPSNYVGFPGGLPGGNPYAGLTPQAIQAAQARAAMSIISSGLYNAPGGKGGGKGAGGGYGQMQRAKKKETKRMQQMMRQVATKTNAQTYMDQGFSEAEAAEIAGAHAEMYGTPNTVREYFASKNMGPTSVYGTMDELRAAGVDARPSVATSYGMPKNWEDEIFPYYEKHGTYEGAPDPRAMYDEEDLSPLGIRSLPSQITENEKPYWWPEGLPWTGDRG